MQDESVSRTQNSLRWNGWQLVSLNAHNLFLYLQSVHAQPEEASLSHPFLYSVFRVLYNVTIQALVYVAARNPQICTAGQGSSSFTP